VEVTVEQVEVTVEQDVGWLVDRAKIIELTARYNRCFDDGDVEGFAGTFTDDGVMEVTGSFSASGREALADMCRHTPWGTMHVTTSNTVEVDGDHAIQNVTLLVVSRPASKGDVPKLVGTGRYVDELSRTDDGWRFQKRSATLDGWNDK
jgi:uncharacterized protein (TIGR02246 family)